MIFGAVLLYSAWTSMRQHGDLPVDRRSPACDLRLNGSLSRRGGRKVDYMVTHVRGGFGLMYVAGLLSGLLGIGSGAMKVIAMDQVMRIPFKVSTTTSNFMIGVTAAASAGVYLNRGIFVPALTMPVMLGVLGSLLGARRLAGAPTLTLRLVFAAWSAVGGRNDLQRPNGETLMPLSDRRVDEIIGGLLRYGVTLSAWSWRRVASGI